MLNAPEFESPEYFRILDNIREEDFPDIQRVCNVFNFFLNFLIILF